MNCSKNKTSELHSVVFKTDPPNRWTTETSRKWLKDHDIERLKSVDKTKNSLRYRIVDPKCFKSFSTQVVKSDMGTINLIIGWYVKQPKKKRTQKSSATGGRLRSLKSSNAKAPKRKKIKKEIILKSDLLRGKKSKGVIHFSGRQKK